MEELWTATGGETVMLGQQAGAAGMRYLHVVPGGNWYALGRVVGLAWLVGPLAAGLLVGGSALAAHCWYGARAGLTTLVLGALSPFVLFTASAQKQRRAGFQL